MVNIEYPDILGKVIADAIAAIDSNNKLQAWEKERFFRAVAKAAARIDEQAEFMEFDADADLLTIWSQSSNNVYNVHGTECLCEASARGFICWHKAAKRLIERYHAAEIVALAFEGMRNRAAADDMSNAPYLKQSSDKPAETIGGVRI